MCVCVCEREREREREREHNEHAIAAWTYNPHSVNSHQLYCINVLLCKHVCINSENMCMYYFNKCVCVHGSGVHVCYIVLYIYTMYNFEFANMSE